jgi:hypothetical protein
LVIHFGFGAPEAAAELTQGDDSRGPGKVQILSFGFGCAYRALNLVSQRPLMRGKLCKKLFLGRVGREPANQFAVLSFNAKFLQVREHVLHWFRSRCLETLVPQGTPSQ